MLKKAILTLILVVFLTGCAGTASQTATEFTVEATDYAFAPLSITIPAGEPVTLNLKNLGAREHDYVIEKIDVTDVVASDSMPAEHHQMGDMPDFDLHFFAKAGETASVQFTALEPGTYEVFCSIEGHKEAGMVGKLIVAAQE